MTQKHAQRLPVVLKRYPCLLLLPLLLVLYPLPMLTHRFLPAPPPLTTRLFYAHQHRETCRQWISAQRAASAYLDAYIIGAQKGGTSELTKRLHKLGVRRGGLDAVKEWHFFNHLSADGDPSRYDTSKADFNASDIAALKLKHMQSGRKEGYHGESGREGVLELVDDRPVQNRSIVYDGCVEYSHSDRSAFIAHLLTPHARVVLMVREPVGRAVSQYNMKVRNHNEKESVKVTANASRFDELVSEEMNALQECGYVPSSGYSPVGTADMIACVQKIVKGAQLFVFRGLYHLHVASWLRYFPKHRMMFLKFDDMLSADEHALNGLARFLCVKDFSKELLDEFRAKSSAGVSFGKQMQVYGKTNGTDDLSGANQYFDDLLPATRSKLQSFYSGAHQRLTEMMGTEMYTPDVY